MSIVVSAFLVIVDAAVRSTALIGMVIVATWLWRRGSAAHRYRMWLFGLAGTLLMPLVVSLVPAYTLTRPRATVPVDAALARGLALIASAHSAGQPATSTARETRVATDIGSGPTAGKTRESSTARSGRAWITMLGIAWGVGAASVGCWLLTGVNGMRRIRRRASPAVDAAAVAAGCAAQRALGLPTRPPLLYTEAVPVPLVCGWLRPAVLLPPSVREWPTGDLEAVLLHELAHVKRYDGVGQLLSAVTLIVYWFHPLVWFAARTLAAERELACDEIVLNAGVERCAYADQLLGLARRFVVTARPAVTMMSARPSGLEQRIRHILAWKPRRVRPHRGARAIGTALSISILMGLGALRFAPPASAYALRPRTTPNVGAPPGVVERAATSASQSMRRVVGPASRDRVSKRDVSSIIRLRLPTRDGVCGDGVPNEITFVRGATPEPAAAGCRSGFALIEVQQRNGGVVEVNATVGGDDTSGDSSSDPAAIAAWLLDAAATLPPAAAARAAQAASIIRGPDIEARLVALASRPAMGAAAQRMSVVWADIIGGAAAREPLLGILRDETLEPSVREQVIIALNSAAFPAALQVARSSSNEAMRVLAAHRLALAWPVDTLLAQYPLLPDAASRQDWIDQISVRGTTDQRHRLVTLLTDETDVGVRTRGLERLREG